jgi:L-ribulose-5-phosphate 3-epimerase
MLPALTRRDFLISSAAVGAGLAMTGVLPAAEFKTKLRKALIRKPDETTFAQLKAAGFDGMETTDWKVEVQQADADRKLVEQQGLKIHSVLFGWANFNIAEKLEGDIANVTAALGAARAYGAEALLLVPCRLDGMTTPQPWEFKIEFDEKTNHIQRIVEGDNSRYEKYIQAHNRAVDATRAAVRRLIPAAEKAGVVIALENVWNNLWVQPAIFANFVASFENPWVRAYFDIGNHVKYAPPEEWIRALGKLLVKCHVKDFKLNPDGRGGNWANIREGSVNWPRVRRELEEVGYNGWLTVEGSRLSVEEQSKRLDRIIAGE